MHKNSKSNTLKGRKKKVLVKRLLKLNVCSPVTMFKHGPLRSMTPQISPTLLNNANVSLSYLSASKVNGDRTKATDTKKGRNRNGGFLDHTSHAQKLKTEPEGTHRKKKTALCKVTSER